jgi:hypothetical protein
VINRQKLCPECRAPVQEEELIKNIQLHKLLADLLAEQQRERKQSVNKLVEPI